VDVGAADPSWRTARDADVFPGLAPSARGLGAADHGADRGRGLLHQQQHLRSLYDVLLRPDRLQHGEAGIPLGAGCARADPRTHGGDQSPLVAADRARRLEYPRRAQHLTDHHRYDGAGAVLSVAAPVAGPARRAGGESRRGAGRVRRMRVVYSGRPLRHQPPQIVARGRPQDHPEVARRGEELLGAARRDGHAIVAPAAYGAGPRAAVHTPEYLDFLERAFREWQALPDPTPAVQAHAYPNRRMQSRPSGIIGLAGWHMATNSCPIVEGTWEASCAAADVAVHAAQIVLDGAPAAYALCRPPGHHAFADLAGGFCYLNNAAIAAQYLRRRLDRVAILDIDVHH